MRSTLASLGLLLTACASSGKEVRPHLFERGRRYEATHQLRVLRSGTTPGGIPFSRDLIRSEKYTDTLLTQQRAQRIYTLYELTEETTIGEEVTRTNLDPDILRRKITLLRTGRNWRPIPGSSDVAEGLLANGTDIGPPRFWTGRSRKWRTFKNEPLLRFLGLGRFESGTLRARFERWSSHDGFPNALIAVEIEETYSRVRAVAKGWLIFDLEWGMVAKLALNGRIARNNHPPEDFQATRTWAPGEEKP